MSTTEATASTALRGADPNLVGATWRIPDDGSTCTIAALDADHGYTSVTLVIGRPTAGFDAGSAFTLRVLHPEGAKPRVLRITPASGPFVKGHPAETLVQLANRVFGGKQSLAIYHHGLVNATS
jgi:hypothetical protein